MTLQQIDNLCDEFETALRKGDTVRIEDMLPKIDEAQRSALLCELLQIDIQFAIESPRSDDALKSMLESLKNRFPDQHDLIQSLFRRTVHLKQVGDYEILGELGRGGMGTVYKAKHKLLQQTVAIKVLSETLLDDTQAVGRFRREMQLIGGLAHPNIVRALNAGEADGVHYLAMEYVDGITLQKLVEKVRINESTKATGFRPTTAQQRVSDNESGDGILKKSAGASPPLISPGAACEMIHQAALGLQNAHELKLVHRDIKPANLMLDRQGTVKILDLGLGKFAEEHRQDYHSSLTMAGMVIGTVDYISPEQCENSSEADIRSDLYSLGCSLYFLLTGKPVYSGSRYDTMRKKLMGHIVGDVPSIRQTAPSVPLAIEAILQKVLSKDPTERFQTPIEFAEALAPFASPDELWTLMQEVMPMDTADSRSSMRHSSQYGYVQSSRQNIVPPVSRTKWILFFVMSNLLAVGLVIGAFLYFSHQRFQHPPQEATEALATAVQLRSDWKIAESQVEIQKAIRIFAESYFTARDPAIRETLLYSRIFSAELRWYCGDTGGARRDLQSLLEAIDRFTAEHPSSQELPLFRMSVQERLADITLFGGAASGRNSDRFENGIVRYWEALKLGEDDPRCKAIRWKLAILLTLNGDVNQAEKLLNEHPLPETVTDVYAVLLRQLAEAVVFYYQKAADVAGTNAENRTQKLRTFQRQFASQDNPARGATSQPEVIELLLFCAEFLLRDSVENEDWETLAGDISARRRDTADFLRTRPGALPFVRRFYELLVQSAALVYEKTERQRDKQTQIENIVQILERMRPLPAETDTVGMLPIEMQRPTLVLFFLPEGTVSRAEPGFIVFYPPDGRPGTLYRSALTRQMIKQPMPGKPFPVLDAGLLEQVAEEKAAERRIRISWGDAAAWARTEDALSETEYPYGNVLPLQ